MKNKIRQISFKTRLFLSFLLVIIVIGMLILTYGSLFISDNVYGRVQREVARNINSAWNEYNNEIENLKTVADFVSGAHCGEYRSNKALLEKIKEKYKIDYIIFTPVAANEKIPENLRPRAETRIVPAKELKELNNNLSERAFIKSRETEMAKKIPASDLKDGLVIEVVASYLDVKKQEKGILKIGKLLNKNSEIVDKINSIIFEDQEYKGKPVGTVTLFLKDMRVATNVLTSTGERAIGTYISEKVYDKVITKGNKWRDRAFVVNEWYITAYDPIKDSKGNIVGILYIGRLEAPFIEMRDEMRKDLFLLLLICTLLFMIISYWISIAIDKHFKQMTAAVKQIANSDLNVRVSKDTGITELNMLAEAFNAMATALKEDRREILEANEKLNAANKNYMDMIGFVSHQLKGILGSIVMNIYSIKEGFLGEINEKQKKAIDAVARILDYFENMVKNYLDLSRIEKGELEIKPVVLDFSEDSIKAAIQHFEKQAQERNIKIENNIPAGLKVFADKGLMLIVCDNLLSNAVKYGRKDGNIVLSYEAAEEEFFKFVFYNDSEPISNEKQDLLFKKFSRLPGTEKIKGSGIGLFIIRQIVEKHSGKITHEAVKTGNKFILLIRKGVSK
ncbi:MAG: cache domain-containing protein [Candidatus Firestonebacteria bacterium]